MRLNSMKEIIVWTSIAFVAWAIWIIPFIQCVFNGIAFIFNRIEPLLNLI